MTTEQQFHQFVQAGLYLRGWSPKTASLYRQAFTCYTRFQQSLRESACGVVVRDSNPTISVSIDGVLPLDEQPFTKAQLEAWLVWMRQQGRTAAGCNIYTCVFNSFCSWLKEQGLLKETIKVKKLKNHPKPITVFSENEIRILLANKPKRLTYLRTWTMIVLMLDTGCRIDEVLNLKVADIDFDNLLITVLGKGNKIRRIPFSYEMRKHLWTYCQKIDTLLFGTRNKTRITYRNAYRNIVLCFKTLGIEGAHVHPHTLRHTFACNYMKQNGNIFTLSRLLGHSSVTITQTYLRGLQVEDLKHYSPLTP